MGGWGGMGGWVGMGVSGGGGVFFYFFLSSSLFFCLPFCRQKRKLLEQTDVFKIAQEKYNRVPKSSELNKSNSKKQQICEIPGSPIAVCFLWYKV